MQMWRFEPLTSMLKKQSLTIAPFIDHVSQHIIMHIFLKTYV
jgi:hypothetical protein